MEGANHPALRSAISVSYVSLLSFVIANVSSPAYAEHANKKRCKNHLHTDEKPKRKENQRPNAIEPAKIGRSPAQAQPQQSCSADERQSRSEQQAMFQLHPAQPSGQRALVWRKAFGIAVDLGKCSYGDDLYSEECEHHAEKHSVDVEDDVPDWPW